MIIYCCPKCRLLDVGDAGREMKCMRCLTTMVSSGITTLEWNTYSEEQMKEAADRCLAPYEGVYGGMDAADAGPAGTGHAADGPEERVKEAAAETPQARPREMKPAYNDRPAISATKAVAASSAPAGAAVRKRVSVANAGQMSQEAPADKGKKNKGLIIAAIIAGGLILIGGIVFAAVKILDNMNILSPMEETETLATAEPAPEDTGVAEAEAEPGETEEVLSEEEEPAEAEDAGEEEPEVTEEPSDEEASEPEELSEDDTEDADDTDDSVSEDESGSDAEEETGGDSTSEEEKSKDKSKDKTSDEETSDEEASEEETSEEGSGDDTDENSSEEQEEDKPDQEETDDRDPASKIDRVIPDEYKQSDMYSVNISGSEGALNCKITVVSRSFENADFQSIAVELAEKIKDLDLGIGYLCISFHGDGGFYALSSLDDLNSQDPSEMSTTLL